MGPEGSARGACPACTHWLMGPCSPQGVKAISPEPLFTSCFGLLQPQLVLGGTAQTTSLGTATAVQTGTPQRTVPGATTTSTAATVSSALLHPSGPPWAAGSMFAPHRHLPSLQGLGAVWGHVSRPCRLRAPASLGELQPQTHECIAVCMAL